MPGENELAQIGRIGKWFGGGDTYSEERGGQLRRVRHGCGAVLDLLDLLTDRGEGHDTGHDHGAIGTARCQRRVLGCAVERLTFGRCWWL